MATPLATRCPACGTVFRVVPDQLRVSEGWVRCGRCSEVFDATQSLVDLETGAPRDGADALSPRPAPQTESEQAPPSAAGAFPYSAAPEEAIDAAAAADPSLATRAETPSAPPSPAGQAPLSARPDRQTDLQAEPVPALPAGPSDVPAQRPSFVRRAERAERWRRPRVRAALAAAALLGLVGLVGQIAYEYRDLAAARFPQARPLLEQGCALLGCRIDAARAIDALAVESSGLARVEKSDVYRLSVALRNRAGIEVAVPALDLALTDTQGRRVARRVLLAAELGAASATIGAGRELTMQATLQVVLPADEPVAGYTVELFYP